MIVNMNTRFYDAGNEGDRMGALVCVFFFFFFFSHLSYYLPILLLQHPSANLGNGYVTLYDTTEAMALCAKGPLLQVTMGKFKYMIK